MAKKQLTPEQLADILCLKERGIPIKQLAIRFGVARSTLYRRISKFDNEGVLGRRKTKGRKLKIDSSKLEQLERYVRNFPFSTIQNMREMVELKVDPRTISKYCKKFGLTRFKSPRKFAIKPIDTAKRLIYARQRRLWTANYWKDNYVFTDESGIANSELYEVGVWRPSGQRFNQTYIYNQPNKNFRYNYFSYVSKHGTGNLFLYDKMDSQTYCQAIEMMMQDLLEKFDHDNFRIIHDNARFSTSEYTKTYLAERQYDRYFVKIPPYSPDMNIIENLWAILKFRVNRHMFKFGQIRDKDRFVRLLKNIWAGIGPVIVNNLYKSLPKRMDLIIKTCGNLTKY